MMTENIHQITIGGNRTIAEVVARSGYVDYDPSILERCTLVPGPKRKVTIKIFPMEHFDHDPTDAEIEAEYVRHNLKRPILDHIVYFGDQKRDLPEEGHPIIFYLDVPVPGAFGFCSVPFLWRNGTGRMLYWTWLHPGDRLARYCHFAGVRE